MRAALRNLVGNSGIIGVCDDLLFDYTPVAYDWAKEIIPSGMGHYIVIDSNNVIHVTYCMYDDIILMNRIWHAWSENGGHTWSKEIILDTTNRDIFDQNYPQNTPQVVVDKDDNLYFIWSTNMQAITVREKYADGTWGEQGFFPYIGTFNIGYPSCAIGADGLTLAVSYSGPQCFGSAGVGTDVFTGLKAPDGGWTIYYQQWDSSDPTQIIHPSYSPVGMPLHSSSDYNPTENKYQIFIWSEEPLIRDIDSGDIADPNPVCPSSRILDKDGMRHYGQIHINQGLVYHTQIVEDIVYSSKIIDPDAVEFVNAQLSSNGIMTFYYGVNIEGDIAGACISYNRATDTIGERTLWYREMNRSVKKCAVPWSSYPSVLGKYSQLSKQGNCIMFVTTVTNDITEGRLQFTATDDSIVGDTIEIGTSLAISQRCRGDINVGVINKRSINEGVIK